MIQLTEILGTDSVSSSRLVINDNFKILANEINNISTSFDGESIFLSEIHSVSDSIEISCSDASSIVISSDGVNISGDTNIESDLNVEGNVSVGENINASNINSDADDMLTITGNVNIIGNLEVSGTFPTHDDNTNTYHDPRYITNFEMGFVKYYSYGNIVNWNTAFRPDDPQYLHPILTLEQLYELIGQERSEEADIMKYINRPLFIYGTNMRIRTTPGNTGFSTKLSKIITNGTFIKYTPFDTPDYRAISFPDENDSIELVPPSPFSYVYNPAFSTIYNDEHDNRWVIKNTPYQTSMNDHVSDTDIRGTYRRAEGNMNSESHGDFYRHTLLKITPLIIHDTPQSSTDLFLNINISESFTSKNIFY